MNDGGEKPSTRLREKEQITMNIVCLDMEGVLVPEIWIAFAEASGIPRTEAHHPG